MHRSRTPPSSPAIYDDHHGDRSKRRRRGLTEANGLPRERFFELILGTLFGSRSYQVYSAIIAERKYQPGFKAVLRLKDLRLAAEAAEQAGRELPMLSAVHRQMAETVAAGQGDRDWSAIAEYAIRGGI